MAATFGAEPARRGREQKPAAEPGERQARPGAQSALSRELSQVVRRGPSESWRPGGQPLEGGLRKEMEGDLGVDLSGVRVDTSARAAADSAAVGALAFTRGTDIAFGKGRFSPGTTEGRGLLAHELRHARADAHDGLVHLAADPERVAERISTSSESGEVHPLIEVSADDWMTGHGVRLARELASWLTDVRLEPPLLELHWHLSSRDFMRTLVGLAGATSEQVAYTLSGWLLPDRLSDAVNAGRDSVVRRLGTPLYVDGVRDEIGRRLLARILQSFERVAPRVARDAARAWTPDPTGMARPSAIDMVGRVTMPSTTLILVLSTAPPAAGGSFSHPLDPAVYLALRTTVDVEAALWRAEHPEQFGPGAAARDEAPLRAVEFDYLGREGLPNWVRARPADAGAEEVAYALYGWSGAAWRLLPASPLWGLPEQDLPRGPLLDPNVPISLHLPPIDAEDALPLLPAVHAAMQKSNESGPTTKETSPESQLLDSKLGDAAALTAAARIRPTPGANDTLILERLFYEVDLLNQMAGPAGDLMRPPHVSPIRIVIDQAKGQSWTEPYDPPETVDIRARLERVRERITRRRESLAGQPGIAAIWDGQTAGQLEILLRVHAGLMTAQGLAHQFEGWPEIYRLVQDVATGYVEAAEVSDLYQLGRARLASAERRSILFPVTAMELWLAQLRAVLDEARTTEITAVKLPDPGITRDVNRMDAIEADLRSRLAGVRSRLLQDPTGAAGELKAIFGSLETLQTGASIALNLDTVDQVWQALYDSITFWGEVRRAFGGGNKNIEEALRETLKIQGEWEEILGVWRSGEHDKARRMLAEKAKGPWRTWVQKMQKLIEDHHAWDQLMTFAALVGIAVLSGGLGAYVEVAAGAAWGVGTATGTVWAELGAVGLGVATEATFFTAMSYPMTARDLSLGEFGEQLGTNLLFSGGARALGRGFEALVGASRAATPLGRVANAGIQATAMLGANLVMADQEARRTRGEGLDAGELASISLENAAFMGLVTLVSTLTRSPLRNLRLAGRMRGLQLRHQRALTAVEGTMAALPPGRAPKELSHRLTQQVEDALTAEHALVTELTARVAEADALPLPDREGALRRWGIDAPVAEQLRSGRTNSQVLANLRHLQGVRVAKALTAVGNDFAVDAAMYDETVAWYESVPGAKVTAAGGLGAVHPLSATRSFVVEVPGELPFRVMERIRTAAGELAPRVELAKDPASVAAERGPVTSRGSASGGRAFADPVRWGLPAEAIQAVRNRLVGARDVGHVQRTAAEGGLDVDRATLQRVKSYLFDSAGIDFLPENVAWWNRLVSGRASVHDVSILVHEVGENLRLEKVRQKTGFDYMGRDFQQLSGTAKQHWKADFTRVYEEAHRGALEDEYDFVAAEVRRLTNNRVRIGRNEAAAIDPTRAEGRRYLHQDGIPLEEHNQFADWQTRGQAEVEIGTSAARRLGLPDNFPTRRELVGAVKRHGGFAPLEIGGGRVGGARAGGSTWDPSRYTDITAENILTVPFADGLTIGRELFARGRDLLIRAGNLSAAAKADAFEQLAERITRIDPSWSASRGPATNAVGFFTGEGRPFGFAVDHEGVIWQTQDVSKSVRLGPKAVATIDFSKWERRSP